MKNIKWLILIIVLILPSNVFAFFAINDTYLKDYSIQITVDEKNVLHIIEHFYIQDVTDEDVLLKTIPLYSDDVHYKVNHVKVNGKYKVKKENGNLNIYLSNLKENTKYSIEYNYFLGLDKNDDYDELKTSLASGYNFPIESMKFTITMPKPIDISGLNNSLNINDNNLKYSVLGTIISGKYNEIINNQEGINFNMSLENGYFNKAQDPYMIEKIFYWGIPFIGLVISIVLWLVFGRDKSIKETVEFYPPENINPVDLAYIDKESVEVKDVMALILHLANKGYLKIVDSSQKKNKTVILKKIKEYDGNDYSEKVFFEGLFPKNKKTFDINKSSAELRIIIEQVIALKNNSLNKNKLYTKNTGVISKIIMSFMISSLIVFVYIPTLHINSIGIALFSVLITLSLVLIIFMGLHRDLPITFSILIVPISILLLGFIFNKLPLSVAIKTHKIYLYGSLFIIVCELIMSILYIRMPKRNKNGYNLYFHVHSFKNFMEYANVEQLNLLISNDKDYFYKIYPFAFVLSKNEKIANILKDRKLNTIDSYKELSRLNVINFNKRVKELFSKIK